MWKNGKIYTMEAKSRFNIENRNKIIDKYVLYVENIRVNFKATSENKNIKNRIKSLKKMTKSLNSKIYKEKIIEIENEINELKAQLSNFKNDNKRDSNLRVKEILKGITFGLRQGETLAILGANGAGKTVLIETIFGMITPEKNSKIFINLGHKTYAENILEVGIQYQQSKFPDSLKVSSIIDEHKKLYGDRVDLIELQKMMEIFGIFEFINTKIGKLSGGQRQRLNLLLAIMHQPKLMILDEFITGLDVRTVRNIISYVNGLKIKNNASMIIISHQPEEIKELSDRIIVIKEGIISEETDVNNAIKNYGSIELFVEGVI